MNKKIKTIALASALMASFAIGVSASSEIKDITAQINYAIKMKVDNVEWNPSESDGSAIRPITYNGRTYLPVRALCDKLGVAVDWDADQQLISIGNKEWTPLTADMVKASNNRIGYTTDKDQLYNGKEAYDFGIFVDKQTNLNGWIELTMNGSYQTMKFSAFVSGGERLVTIRDKDTGAIYKQMTLKDGEVVDTEFAINGAKQLEVRWDDQKADRLAIGNIYVK